MWPFRSTAIAAARHAKADTTVGYDQSE